MRLVELTDENSDSLDALVMIAGPRALIELHEHLLQCGGRFHRRCQLYGQALDHWPMTGGHRYVIAFDDAAHDHSTIGYAIHPWNCRKAIGDALLLANSRSVRELGYCVILDDPAETQLVEQWLTAMAQVIAEHGVSYAVEGHA